MFHMGHSRGVRYPEFFHVQSLFSKHLSEKLLCRSPASRQLSSRCRRKLNMYTQRHSSSSSSSKVSQTLAGTKWEEAAAARAKGNGCELWGTIRPGTNQGKHSSFVLSAGPFRSEVFRSVQIVARTCAASLRLEVRFFFLRSMMWQICRHALFFLLCSVA